MGIDISRMPGPNRTNAQTQSPTSDQIKLPSIKREVSPKAVQWVSFNLSLLDTSMRSPRKSHQPTPWALAEPKSNNCSNETVDTSSLMSVSQLRLKLEIESGKPMPMQMETFMRGSDGRLHRYDSDNDYLSSGSGYDSDLNGLDA